MKLRNVIPATAILALGTTGAMAMGKAQINLEARTDYVNTDNDTKQTGTPNTSRFQIERLRMKMTGQVTDNTKFVSRVRLNKMSGNAANSVDGTDRNFFEYGYFQTNWGHGLTTVFGKFVALVGGWENDYAGSDVYQYSDAVGVVPAYEAGVSVNYSVAGQSLWLQVMNSDTDSASNHRNHMIGATWYGNIMDGMIKTIWNYHQKRHSGSSSAASDKREDFYTLGTQFNHSMISVDLDWHNYVAKDNTVVGQDLERSGIAAKVLYKGSHFRPYVKYTTSSYEDDASGNTAINEYDVNTYTVALQYYPKKDKNFRYHLAYTSSDTDYKRAPTTSKDFETTKIFFGMKASIDLL